MMNVYDYTDYREYLRDFYHTQKKKSPSYSFRLFAMRAKLASPNYLKLVIDGDRRVTEKNLHHFVRGLRLNKQESEFFKNLVHYQETRDVEAKESHLKEIIRLRKKSQRKVHSLEDDRREILSSWHHIAIRELVLLKEFRNDPAWIAHKFGNRITAKQAKESIELLLRLKFLEEVDGKFIQRDPLIKTSDGISSLLLRKLHHQFIELGVDSIFNSPIEDRSVGGLTIAIPKKRLAAMNQAISNFKSELNQLYSNPENTDDDNDEVYHLVFNFFPLTRDGGRP